MISPASFAPNAGTSIKSANSEVSGTNSDSCSVLILLVDVAAPTHDIWSLSERQSPGEKGGGLLTSRTFIVNILYCGLVTPKASTAISNFFGGSCELPKCS